MQRPNKKHLLTTEGDGLLEAVVWFSLKLHSQNSQQLLLA